MAGIIPIDDPGDPRVSDYLDIRERDLVGRRKLFVAEGRVVVEKLLDSASFRPLSLLVAAHRISTVESLTRRFDPVVPVFAASQAVMDRIVGFPIHRGILALGQRVAQPSAIDILDRLPQRATMLFLSAIANHDNIGGIFRNAAAFGADAILLDADCCDPLYRKAIRVAVGATFMVPFARLDRGEDAIALLSAHGFASYALSPAGEVELSDVAPAARNALLLGAEGPGLAPELLARVKSVRIAMTGGFDSLNVAVTSGIVLHHFRRHS